MTTSTPTSSRPYGIRRMALQVELTDGRIMTFYSGPEQAAERGATITVDHDAEVTFESGPRRRGPGEYSIRVNSLGGYVMTLRHPPADYDPLLQQPKEITS